ncbi:hypothetical protein OSB04_031300 [Centaurea solstitialis]|uniref:Uncharacterized protein n=1 Tax=Centaurea solstitialis TaxID=347529 RepID=A0AA38VU64_9ASTR|nr:hypothetical protein OSB04_031300 [Centaurea solstitialis]
MLIEPISMSFDLLLIENQIPFFVLKDIFDCTASRFEQKEPSLHLLIMHGLRFLKSRFKIKKGTSTVKTNQSSFSKTFYSAVELDRAGVKFKPHHLSGRRWSMDFRFEFSRWSWCRPWPKPTTTRKTGNSGGYFRHPPEIFPADFRWLNISDEDSKLLHGNANGDVEIGNIEDPLQFPLHSPRKQSNINSPAIHMIPSRIRDLNPKVFNLRYVSIGPLHKKNKNLEAFEGRKAIFLNDLLDQTGLPQEQTLEKCVEKVKTSIGKIKACYGDGIEWYNDNDITKIMVMDACFVLEFLYKKVFFDENMLIEPISMSFDLLLIENQILFFVLKDMFDCTASRFEQKEPSLHLLIMHGFDKTLRFIKSRFKI